MVLDNFKEKFGRLIKILTTDENIAKEFSSIETVDESFDFACRLVGNMDRGMYHVAVKEYIENLDSDQENVFDSSFEDSTRKDISNANSSSGDFSRSIDEISSLNHPDDGESMTNQESNQQKEVLDDSFNNSVKNDAIEHNDTSSSNFNAYSSKVNDKKSSYSYDPPRNKYKKVSSYDEKKVSGGLSFRHHKMYI